MVKIKEKLKSKVVWLTAIPLMANLVGMFCPDYVDSFARIGTTLVSLLAIFGILNNPNDKEGF